MNLKRILHLAVTLAVFTALALSSVVWADNVVNTLDNTIDNPKEEIEVRAGGPVEVGFRIIATKDQGESSAICNVDDGHPATLSFVGLPSGITAGMTTFTACGVEKKITFTIPSSVAQGTYNVNTSNFNMSGGKSGASWDFGYAQFQIKVLPPSDTTPPVITPIISGTLGNNGWYISDVTVSWTVTDSESAITSKSGCDETTINDDTAGVTLTCTATSAGGAAQASVIIKRDATPPSITAALDKSAASTGWYNSDTGAPTVSFTCSDAMSGLVGDCPGSYTFGEGANQSYSQTIYDNAGNSATAEVSGINVDLTPPSITWNGGPADGESYYFGFVPPASTCTAEDGLSGLTEAGCTLSGYSTAVGTHTLTATATDKAGNTTEKTRTYTVLAWTLKGFYQPVDMNGVYNVAKGGSTVPLKFEIFAGPTELTDTAFVRSLTYAQTACAADALTDEIETVATGGTSLRYDWMTGQFIFNWKTPTTPGKCYRVTMTTMDGSFLQAFFKIK
ncbi:PxKF domain-containing protein [uncultured Thermanaerothrix sp.]|uniref:PxKF domain-containing protein n=1 Tax=uncultured Thermanaerothrix sp. TaxID=1195149 RepID=UPI002606F6A0|nr:PxKF domain-containing protein [uncultured Thermanaerothrix sp.]